MAGDEEANIDWNADDVHNSMRAPSPSTGISEMTLGESAEHTPLARQNNRLISERVMETEAVLPQEKLPEVDNPQDDSSTETPPKAVSESDIVELFATLEEL